MINKILLFVLFFSGGIAYSQQNGCKVIKPEISGSYSGGCKNGLAQGKGVAQGVDYYVGQFNKGLPSGKGTYKWADGTSFEGHWDNGVKEGAGKMVYKDSVISGYWKTDKYVGKIQMLPYSVTRSMNVTRSSIKKTIGALDGVKIRIVRGGGDNTDISDLSIYYSSGDEYRISNTYGVQNVHFPLSVKVNYNSWNSFHTSQTSVVFEFEIIEPGIWEVTISN
jgi:hypothetical protein